LSVVALIVPITGVIILIITLFGGLIFHLGWRNRHAGERWPGFAFASVGAGLVLGAGLILFNWLIAAAGIALFFVGRYMTARAVSAAGGSASL
jgi:hypothetical protein